MSLEQLMASCETAKANGWVRVSNYNGYYFARGEEMAEVRRQDGYALVPLTAAERGKVLADAVVQADVAAKAKAELDAYYAAWDAANPRIPMDKGGLEALIEADRPK